ncbi:hypothetical protein F4813DRAFT_353241 [Daldinia decipiens]|uniref:uncharacterized protein n=1 Tax=Daldinia decipiens TaxID=326647 RepID=UPI0020C2CBCA|nr:uncharacterized protein F4813DRAFT_353241 [Daldinia decipiens]KAI1659536.1 hypothetical protein F4813DRAFT_353241 [Daldinia decipiens]
MTFPLSQQFTLYLTQYNHSPATSYRIPPIVDEGYELEGTYIELNGIGRCDGLMSARANLKDDKVRAEYERSYKLALGFFHDHF